MKLRHIEIVHAIVQSGSMSGAARLLNVSQPNISRVLNHAEQQLGFSLFERHHQGMFLTSEGQLLLPDILDIYEKLSVLSRHADKLKFSGDVVKVGASHALGQSVMTPALVEYRRQVPHGSVELATGHFDNLCQDLLAGKIDFALAFGEQIDQGLLAEPIFQSSLVAILPKNYPCSDTVTLEWLSQNNLLMMQKNDPLGQVLHRNLSRLEITSYNSLLIKTYSMIADLVLAEEGVGIVDLFTACSYAGRINILPIAEPLPFEVMFVSRRDTPQSHSTLVFKQIIRGKLREISSVFQQKYLQIAA
ncbi:LysR family transcriptional regulator [Rosenbergiella australiborealis]|uniref:LysR family transcriptional regulator n=2 Tax=Rosenbergiella TaxID=1356488 RepID=UPI001F4F08C7|nr:LysR family transcriptional regulator [Rosenbergiella australiborealis]